MTVIDSEIASHQDYELAIIRLIKSDAQRMRALRLVRDLALEDCLVAAGFVRNAIWDNWHGIATPLNDIDVIYYSRDQIDPRCDRLLEEKLRAQAPDLPWSVKNQAHMHLRNDDAPYLSSLHAMAYWPEQQTAIGVRLTADDHLQVYSPFALAVLFNGKITHNRQRSLQVFNERVQRKGWLTTWPLLDIQL